MAAIEAVAVALVVVTGVYLVALGGAALVVPRRATAFLGGFARSSRAHYVELFVRMLVGVAFIAGAGQMKFVALFQAFGWVLVATTLALLLMPWRWHRRFAAWSVPLAVRRLPLLGIASLAAGAFVLFSVTP